MNNNKWVLSVRTSLPDRCNRIADHFPVFYVFDSFEKGKSAMRSIIKKYAFSNNSMFDGNGQIIQLGDYTQDSLDEEFEDGDWLNKRILLALQSALKDAFSGNEKPLELSDGEYADCMLALKVDKGAIDMYGHEEGPSNGIVPVLKTNIFSMDTEQDYYLYIDDLFGQDDNSSELYIDLKKADIYF